MKNIHILPTDKPSKLFIDIEDNKLKITIPIGGEHMMNQNIYITNNEEIIEEYWCIDKHNVVYKQKTDKIFSEFTGSKKIILTTDTDLIKDGVQAIDDEFLEWFVKNPSCEEVETYSLGIKNEETGESCHYEYEIVIPKEEPKQENCCTPVGQIKRYVDCYGCDRKPKQETLEEAAEVYANKKGDIPTTKLEDAIFKQGFIDGAKWQQERSYSEEDMKLAFETGRNFQLTGENNFVELIEKLKKK